MPNSRTSSGVIRSRRRRQAETDDSANCEAEMCKNQSMMVHRNNEVAKVYQSVI